jgi:xanthine dehydrogenase accessory factor
MSGLKAFLEGCGRAVRVRIVRAEGSSPREAGAEMFVSGTGAHGTIGGGQLEYMALDQARAMLRSGANHTGMNVPLGPEIGQCCGGRVEIALDWMDAAMRLAAISTDAAMTEARPEVMIFGAGHVGRALARVMALLPVRAVLIDSRSEELSLAESGMVKRLTPLPESEIHTAGYGAAFVILTHDHALDFLLVAEALRRDDAAYVGMIGSASKRASFVGWARRQAPEVDAGRLICPMGAAGLGDKRPEVIAAFIAAEVMGALTTMQNIRQGMEANG